LEDWNQFGDVYDHPQFLGTPRCYLIASLPRSGSHYLGHLLMETGMFGSPLEYLHPGHLRTWKAKFGAESTHALLLNLFRCRTSPSGLFGIKAHWPQFDAMLREAGCSELLTFEKYIYITRADVVAQAISLVKARQTGAWISFHDARGEPRYDFEAIIAAKREIEEQSARWEAFFAEKRASPIRVTYEELIVGPDDVRAAICQAFDIRTSSQREIDRPTRQSTDVNRAWRARFVADLASSAAAGRSE
jgi:trehalose 2-sulfotransferase